MKTPTIEERLQRLTSTGYTHALVFHAHHNEFGQLSADLLPWCDAKSGHDWVTTINAKHKAGKLPYRVTSYEVRTIRKD